MDTQCSSSVPFLGSFHPYPSPSDGTVTMEVTPGLARAWLEDGDFTRQRSLKQRLVSLLATQMSDGKWTPGVGKIAWGITPDGTAYSIDGQHTLHAIVESETSVEMDVRSYACSDTEEVAAIFSRINVGGRRTDADNISAFRLQDSIDAPKGFIGSAAAAIKFIISGFKRPSVGREGYKYRMDKQGLVEELRKWAAPIEAAYVAFDGAPGHMSSKLTRMCVLSVTLATLKSPDKQTRMKARLFWQDVAQAAKGIMHPSRILNDRIDRYGLGRQSKLKESPEKQARACAVAWNHYMEKKVAFGHIAQTKGKNEHLAIYVTDASAPVQLAGTPFHPDAEPIAA